MHLLQVADLGWSRVNGKIFIKFKHLIVILLHGSPRLNESATVSTTPDAPKQIRVLSGKVDLAISVKKLPSTVSLILEIFGKYLVIFST